MIVTTFTLLGSIGMFLFGMKIMSEALQKLSGERLRAIMQAMTGNRFSGLATGFGVTCLVQSSTATTVMIVSFVNAGLLSLTGAIAMIMGANLGTTTTFWFISFLGFKFSVSTIALPVIGLALPFIFSRRPRLRNTGEFFMGFGILFIGLMFLTQNVPDIQNNPEALAFIQKFTGHGVLSVLAFVIFGTLLTIVVQSSTVAGAITIAMAAKGWIDYPSACAIILGENLGTTITANIAALGASTNARRAALVHFVFNAFGLVWAILLFEPFSRFIAFVMRLDPVDPAGMPLLLAAFHSIYNAFNIAIQIGFVDRLRRFVTLLIKDKPAPGRSGPATSHMTYESALTPQTGELNIAEAERDVERMGEITRQLLSRFTELIETAPADLAAHVRAARELEKESDRLAFETTAYLLRCSAGGLSQTTLERIAAHLRVVAELEDICDCGYRLVLLAERRHRKNRALPPETLSQIREFSKVVLQFMDFYSSRLRHDVQTSDMETAYQLENTIDAFRKSLRKESVKRMRISGDSIKAEMLYIDILNNMETIGNHSLNILQSLRHGG